MPGFDEHERQPSRDSSWQATGVAHAMLPCAANFSISPSDKSPAAGSTTTKTLPAGTFSCSAGVMREDAYWHPDMLPAAQQDFAVSQDCSPEYHPESAAVTCHTKQPHTSTHYVSASACGPYSVSYSSEKYVHPHSTAPYAAVPQVISSQLNPVWEFPSHSPQYSVAVGWPVPEPIATMQRLTPPALVSTQPASEDCQPQATAVPVQQQQHQLLGHHENLTNASPDLLNDSPGLPWLQTSCRSNTAPVLRDSPCEMPVGKPCPAGVGICKAEQQSSVLLTEAYCQQHLVNTDMHVLADLAARHDYFEQVLLFTGCCPKDAVSTLDTLSVTFASSLP